MYTQVFKKICQNGCLIIYNGTITTLFYILNCVPNALFTLVFKLLNIYCFRGKSKTDVLQFV